MIRMLITVALFTATATTYGQCVGGRCGGGGMVYGQPMYAVPAAPQIIYQPQVRMQPMQYQGTVVNRRTYATPIRNFLFGTGSTQHYYRPMQQQPQQQYGQPYRQSGQPQCINGNCGR